MVCWCLGYDPENGPGTGLNKRVLLIAGLQRIYSSDPKYPYKQLFLKYIVTLGSYI